MRFVVLVLCLGMTAQLAGQSVNLPAGNPAYHWMDRLEIKSGDLAPFHTSHKYYLRRDVANFALQMDTASTVALTDLDRSDLRYIFRDNDVYLAESAFLATKSEKYETRDWPLLVHFYNTPANFYEYVGEEFNISVHPIADYHFGRETTESGSSGYLGQVNGGILQGSINNRVHFYSNITLHYDRYQAHVREFVNNTTAIPGQGHWGRQSTRFGIDSLYDNINAQGYIDFKVTDNIAVQFGHGRHHIGNGFRSMLLSDFSDNYFYLRTNTRFKKFDYQNIFAELRPFSTKQTITGDLTKKYMASHHLSFNVFKNFNIGLLETVILSRNAGFELQYLNPIIFYRSVERSLDSPDNAFIGVDFKWNFLKRFSLYGQLGVDELHASRLIADPNSWAHKFSRQLGLKYIDVLGIDHLDMQLEYNSVRPYTYSHFDSLTTFTHASQPLAHPLGANFHEFIGVLRYQPTNKLFLEARTMFTNIGRDTLGSNWGSDWTLSYLDREGNQAIIGQGVNTNIFMVDFVATYMLYHNVFVDLNVQYRTENSEIDAYDLNQTFFSFGIRWNFWRQPLVF